MLPSGQLETPCALPPAVGAEHLVKQTDAVALDGDKEHYVSCDRDDGGDELVTVMMMMVMMIVAMLMMMIVILKL